MDNRIYHRRVAVAAILLYTATLSATAAAVLPFQDQADPSSASASSSTSSQSPCPAPACLTPACVHIASSLLQALDTSTDPCSDFFRYACGGWHDSNQYRTGPDLMYYAVNFNEIPNLVNRDIGELLKKRKEVAMEFYNTKPYKQLFDFYHSCMDVNKINQDGANAVLKLLSGMGEFQLLGQFNRTSWDLTAAVLALTRVNGVPLLDVALDASTETAGRWAAVVSGPRRYGLRPSLHRQRPSLYGRRPAVGELLSQWRQTEQQRRAVRHPDLLTKLGTNSPPEVASSGGAEDEDINSTTDAFFGGHNDGEVLGSITFTNMSGPTGLENFTSIIENIENYFSEDYNGTVPSWLDEMMRRPVDRRMMFQIIQESLATERLALLLTHLLSVLRQWGLLPSFVEGVPGGAGVEVGVEGALAALEEGFFRPLDQIVPTSREKLVNQQQDDLYNQYSLEQLQEQFSQIEWRRLLTELLGPEFTPDRTIYVYYPQYLRKLNDLLLQTDPWLVHWGMLALYLYDVVSELTTPDPHENRDEFCLEACKNTFGDVLTHLYLHSIGEEAVQQLQQEMSMMLQSLKATLKSSLQQASWLATSERSAAVLKLKRLRATIGALPRHWDIGSVKEAMGEVVITREDFVQNVLQLYKRFRTSLYDLYSGPLDSDVLIWDLTVQPYVVNAFYVQSSNSIVFPEAFFKPPFYWRGAPAYINLATVGTAVSHELFHAFEFSGLKFNHDGLMKSSNDLGSFRQRLTNVSECYHNLLVRNYERVVTHHKSNILLVIDSNITTNENLADVFSLRNAFWSWRHHGERPTLLPGLSLSPEQLFFVAAAQPYCAVLPPLAKVILMELDEHLPNDLRINALMLNTPEFREAFSCPKSSPMASEEPCSIFAEAPQPSEGQAPPSNTVPSEREPSSTSAGSTPHQLDTSTAV